MMNTINLKVQNYLCCFFSTILIIISQSAVAQYSVSDTMDYPLLASVEKMATKLTVVKEANVIYPSILKGNEEQAAEYVENFCNERKEYITKMYKKGRKLLPKAASILKKHKIPQEYKVLMIIESAFNPEAVSRAGAVGYWQFMEGTAKQYGLQCGAVETEETTIEQKTKNKKVKTITKTKFVVKEADDRKNFAKSTAAAARYLRDRRKNLNDDWLLIAASYNCGVGNVWNAMEKCGKANPDFWDIKKYLPAETRAYVMNFLALNVVYNNYDKFLKDKLVFTPEYAETPVVEATPTALPATNIFEKKVEKKAVATEENSIAPESF